SVGQWRPRAPETRGGVTAATRARRRHLGRGTLDRAAGRTDTGSATWRHLMSLEGYGFGHSGCWLHLHLTVHGQRGEFDPLLVLVLEHRLLVHGHIALLFVLALPCGYLEPGAIRVNAH